jgi:N-methylhydantoinase A
MRYQGQAFELAAPWGDVQPDAAQLGALLDRFHELHRQRFSYANRNDMVEIVTLRASAIGRMLQHETVREARRSSGSIPKRAVFVAGAWRDTAICRGGDVAKEIRGPAIIEEEYTTIFVAEGWRCGPGDHGILIATRERPKGGAA